MRRAVVSAHRHFRCYSVELLRPRASIWKDVPDATWSSWRWQLANRVTAAAQLEQLINLTPAERTGCDVSKDRLALAVTPFFASLIDPLDSRCPIRLQVVPQAAEAKTSPGESLDPLGEESTTPIKGIVHRYPDRVLFLVTDRCASYCRYCIRSRFVSNARGYDFMADFDEGLAYIRARPEIRDVLISGGDPLILADKKLDDLLASWGKLSMCSSSASGHGSLCLCHSALLQLSARSSRHAALFS